MPQAVKKQRLTVGKELYSTNPGLICLEKTKNTLTFSQFANVRVLNTLRPDLILRILRLLKQPKTRSELIQSLSRDRPRWVIQELDRLISVNYVHSFNARKTQSRLGPNLLALTLARNSASVAHVSRKLAETRIGIIDLVEASQAVVENLKAAGFKTITIQKGVPAVTKGGPFITGNEFFIVVGDSLQSFVFSKLNQLFRKIRKPWLPVVLDIYGGTLGPTYGVEGGPCYDCLIDHSKRVMGHEFENENYRDLIECQTEEKWTRPTLDYSGVLMPKSVFPLAAIETFKVVSRLARPMTYDGFFTFDFFNFRMDYTGVLPSPVCPTCLEQVR